MPPFAYWDVDAWKNIPDEYRELKDCQIGWDVTDFGSGDFKKTGLFLLTIRNGCFEKYPKPYAEKIMVVEENQVTPMHFHWKKWRILLIAVVEIFWLRFLAATMTSNLTPKMT